MKAPRDFDELFAVPAPWLRSDGPHADLVLSTRIRLARNLSEVPFTHRAHEEQLHGVLSSVASAAEASALRSGLLLRMQELSPIQRQVLVERHLVSHELGDGARPRGIYVTPDDRVSVMVNEEDHLRLQALAPGFQLAEAWTLADAADDALGQTLDFAFSDEIGYLTACPTNAGTGLRASVLIHIPAIVMSNEIQRVLNSVGQLGLNVRGLYGEHSDFMGHLFQVSNQTTLGRSERDSIDHLERVTTHILDQEKRSRERLLRDARAQLEDKVWRSYGILRHCRAIKSKEVIDRCSDLRMGAAIGLSGLPPLNVFNELLVLTQPGHLQLVAGVEMEPAERDIHRARVVRERLQLAERTMQDD
jgi:protein arginine kinase